MKRLLLLAMIAGCVSAVAANAQDNSGLLARMKAMEDRIQSLESEVRTLRAAQTTPGAATARVQEAVAQAAVPPEPPPAQLAQSPAEAPSPALGGAGGAASKVLNPDIAV